MHAHLFACFSTFANSLQFFMTSRVDHATNLCVGTKTALNTIPAHNQSAMKELQLFCVNSQALMINLDRPEGFKLQAQREQVADNTNTGTAEGTTPQLNHSSSGEDALKGYSTGLSHCRVMQLTSSFQLLFVLTNCTHHTGDNESMRVK